ncbi:hypothetical protein SISNIDRAFT_471507 [Sistotremastrum niveocremeum HHB9708]|uniref:Uncharacterized protein n=1 Tax=Sistotremastrum niveocremeum HHB9708 TaxID=1314777 RepID=A0A164MJB4_9AGAM|nr:hypothetical protein SISNIDRAFT_471507 [Sistotremastrum niveocremeum HHB9708]
MEDGLAHQHAVRGARDGGVRLRGESECSKGWVLYQRIKRDRRKMNMNLVEFGHIGYMGQSRTCPAGTVPLGDSRSQFVHLSANYTRHDNIQEDASVAQKNDGGTELSRNTPPRRSTREEYGSNVELWTVDKIDLEAHGYQQYPRAKKLKCPGKRSPFVNSTFCDSKLRDEVAWTNSKPKHPTLEVFLAEQHAGGTSRCSTE